MVTTSVGAPKANDTGSPPGDHGSSTKASTAAQGRARVPSFSTYLRHTNHAGVAGHPGISLPVGHPPEGLPVGRALDGARGADGALLELAEAVEATCRRSGVAGRG